MILSSTWALSPKSTSGYTAQVVWACHSWLNYEMSNNTFHTEEIMKLWSLRYKTLGLKGEVDTLEQWLWVMPSPTSRDKQISICQNSSGSQPDQESRVWREDHHSQEKETSVTETGESAMDSLGPAVDDASWHTDGVLKISWLEGQLQKH